jgi:sulfotransferase family protein
MPPDDSAGPADRDAGSPDRLVTSPVFVLSTMRSGASLLRAMLNAHPMIRSPHKMHLQTLEVKYSELYTGLAMEKLGLDITELEYLLWDRLMHRELMRSGKQIIVEKTPGNALIWRRLRECWPAARYIFLKRHPASVLSSVMDTSQSGWQGLMQILLDHLGTTGGRGGPVTNRPSLADVMTTMVLEHAEGVQQAMRALPGLTVRYEDLTSRPDSTMREVCEFLEVPWVPEIVEHGKQEYGGYDIFMGGLAAQAAPAADDIPDALRPICRLWGYLS